MSCINERQRLPMCGPGKQHAVHQGLQPVVLHDRGSLHLAHESGPEHALDRAPGVIGADTEEKRRPRADPSQHLCQPWHTFACAPIGVDVDLECDGPAMFSGSAATGCCCSSRASLGQIHRARNRSPPPECAARRRRDRPHNSARRRRTAARHARMARCTRLDAGLVDHPPLAVDLPERSRERRRNRPHQVMDVARAGRPVDPAVFRTSPAEVLPRLELLRQPRRRAGDQTRQRARQNDLRGDRDLPENIAGLVILEDGHRELIDDIAGIRAGDSCSAESPRSPARHAGSPSSPAPGRGTSAASSHECSKRPRARHSAGCAPIMERK